MIVAKHDTDHDDHLSFTTQERIERLILSCVGDREAFTMKLASLKTEQEADALISELLQCQAIPGHHQTPHTVDEQGQAIRYSADKDDFAEMRRSKDHRQESYELP